MRFKLDLITSAIRTLTAPAIAWLHMVWIELVLKHLRLHPTVPTCQKFFDRSSLRSTGARDQKKKLSVHVLSSLVHRLSIPSSTPQHTRGRTVIRGFCFHKIAFFDITFVFGFVEWDAPRFSMALLNLMIGACFIKFFACLFCLFSLSLLQFWLRPN